MLIDELKDYLNTVGYRYAVYPDQSGVLLAFPSKEVVLYARLTVEDDRARYISAQIRSSIVVPSNKHQPVMEIITRLNCALGYGTFELDLEVGELRFRTSTFLKGLDVDLPPFRWTPEIYSIDEVFR